VGDGRAVQVCRETNTARPNLVVLGWHYEGQTQALNFTTKSRKVCA
jgi:hypothetical protein